MKNVYKIGVDVNREWNFKNGDLVLVWYDENMHQAIRNRLMCRLGALKLFYNNYGSKISDYLGWSNDEITHQYVKLEVLETLSEDPRILNIECNVYSNDNESIGVNLNITFTDGEQYKDNFILTGDNIE